MTGALALLALAVVAQACALQLVDVRPYAFFQHYLPWSSIVGAPSAAAAGVLLQSIVVLPIAWRRRAQLRAAFTGVLPVRTWLIAGAIAGFSLAVPSISVTFALGEVLLAGWIAGVAALNVVLAVLMLPDAFLARASAWVDARITLGAGGAEPRRWDRRVPWVVAVWVTLAAATASYVVLERVPHIDDSVSNLFQAKYFAQGRLYLPAPPDAEAFRIDLAVVQDGKWFGYAFPGWPAVLAIGVAAGAPWMVNPILGGLLILLAHAWIRRRCDLATANIAVLLLATSSWLIFTSAEMMGHPLTAVLAMGALGAFDRATLERRPRRGWILWSALAGAAVGALMLTRAFDGTLIAIVLAATIVIDRQIRRAFPALVVAGVLAAGVTAISFPYNRAVTGKATYPAHLAWADGRYGPGVDVIGFGPNVGIDRWPNLDPLPGHGAPDVVLNLNKNFFMVNADLFGWATGSVVFIALAFGLGRWRRGDGVLLAVVATFIAGYSLFWFSGGPDLGARYWYPLLVPLAALTARGAQMLAAACARTGRLSLSGARIGAFMLVLAIGAAVTMLPWRAATKHYRYRGISGEVRALAASAGFGRALVFVRASERADFQSAFNLNPATFDGLETVYAFDAGPEHTAAVVRALADRPVWVIGRADVAPGEPAPLVVIAGPLAPGTVPDAGRAAYKLPAFDRPHVFARDHLEQFDAGVDVVGLAHAADPLRFAGADFRDPVAVLGELDRALRRERQPVFVHFHRLERADAIRAEAHHRVAERRVEEHVDDLGEAPVAESRRERVVVALRAVDVARADDQVVAVRDFIDEPGNRERVGIAVGHELDHELALGDFHDFAHRGAVAAPALPQHPQAVRLAPLDRAVGRAAVDDNDFSDPVVLDLRNHDRQGLHFVQRQNGQGRRGAGSQAWSSLHGALMEPRDVSPGDNSGDVVGKDCGRL